MAAGLMIRHQEVGAAAARLVMAVYCLLSAAYCYAEDLPDPTRPPAEISAGSGPAVGVVNNGLQSIIISPNRHAAIINGHTVELGAKYGNSTLVEVNERGVVLLGKQGKRLLALFPDVQLRMKDAASSTQNDMAKPARKKMNAAKQKINEEKSVHPVVKPTTPEEEK